MAEGTTAAKVRANVVGLTDVGRVREHNEDAFLAFDRDASAAIPPDTVHDGELRTALIMVVCDGMGGAAAGEVASRMAVERVAEMLGKADFTTAPPDQISTLMDQAVHKANLEIFEMARANAERRGMGTTLTAAVVTPGRVFVSQVGDSRAYLFRKGFLNQLTKDQSLVGQLVEEGTLTEEEAEKIGAKNIVLQAVGNEESVRVDTKHWPLLRGDVLLLCSDGLSGMVKDARMREILTAAGDDLRAAAHQLVDEANQNGGRDNITVVLGRFEGEGLRAPLETDTTGKLETAGASFKAPPPPDVPNPMKKVALWGAALLAVIAAVFIALRPTTARLVATVKPAGADVTVTGAGVPPRTGVATGGVLALDAIEMGEYEVKVSAKDHFDATIPVAIDTPGVFDLKEVWLRPRPGTLTVSAGEPVTVRLALTASHPEDRKDAKMQLPESVQLAPGEERKFNGVPAGEIRTVASRDGFVPFDKTWTLAPNFEQAVRVPALVERKGTLEVQGCAGGKIRITTSSGDEILPETAVAGPAWEGAIRAVAVRVTVTRPGFRPFEQEVTVTEGGRVQVVVQAKATTVPVTVRGRPNSILALQEWDEAAGAWGRKEEVVADPSGVARFGSRRPGRYQVQADDAGPWTAFEVKPGEADKTVSLDGR